MLVIMGVKVYFRRITKQFSIRRYRWLTRNSYVPLVELLSGPNRTINKGKFAGQACYYKTGLLNVLIKLKPKVCLEIGTYYGGTTKVFEYYFKKYQPEGVLITADIRRYIDVKSDRVRQVLVYPHIPNVGDYHDVFPEQILPDFQHHFRDSVRANCDILWKELNAIAAKAFDFCFIDGDHTEISFLRDLEIARSLSKYPHYALLDDTKDEIHECAFVYERLKSHFNHYDFDDWPVFVGASLIWY